MLVKERERDQVSVGLKVETHIEARRMSSKTATDQNTAPSIVSDNKIIRSYTTYVYFQTPEVLVRFQPRDNHVLHETMIISLQQFASDHVNEYHSTKKNYKIQK